MTRRQRLIREARDAIRFRGHVMKRFRRNMRGGAFYECPACEASVVVIVKPMPNQCELMGDALALHCAGSQLAMYRRIK